MDWDRYKRICDRPDVFSRWMLEQTRELVEADLALRLAAVQDGLPVEKPADHLGGAPTDMFALTLSVLEVERICLAIESAITAGVTTSATRRRGLGGFQEAWTEYLTGLATGAARVP